MTVQQYDIVTMWQYEGKPALYKLVQMQELQQPFWEKSTHNRLLANLKKMTKTTLAAKNI